MNWDALMAEYRSKYPYLQSMKVTNRSTGQISGLSTIIAYSAAFANRTFEQHKSMRLCIQMPNKADAALWIALISAFEAMRNGVDSIYQAGTGFKKEQMLRLYDAIVRYIGIFFRDGESKIAISYDGVDHYLPEEKFKSLFQRINTSRSPSTNKVVCNAVKQAKDYVKINETRPLSAIEKILGFRTFDNPALFSSSVGLLTQSVLLDQFMDRYELEGQSIDHLLLVALANENGEQIMRQAGQFDCPAQLVHSYDMYNMLRYIRKFKPNMAGLVVDGMEMLIKSLSEIDRFLEETSIPVVVVCSDSDIEQMNYLEERNLAIWKWHSKILLECGYGSITKPDSAFFMFENRTSNALAANRKAELCRNDGLERVYRSIRSIENDIRNDFPKFLSLYAELAQLLVRINRIVILPDEPWFAALASKANAWQIELTRNALYLPAELYDKINNALDWVKHLKQVDLVNDQGKHCKLRGLLGTIKGHKVVVTPKNMATDMEKNTICHLAPDTDFLSFDQVFETANSRTYDCMIITGWFRRSIMSKLLNSGIAADIRILVFPWEYQWFSMATRKWHRIDKSQSIANDFSFLSLDEVSDTDFSIAFEESDEEFETVSYLEEDDELLLRRAFVKETSEHDISNHGELQPAKMLLFADGWFMMASRDKTFLDVTPFIIGSKKSTETIPYQKLDNLTNGNWILIPETDKDILRSVVDRKLEKTGKCSLRDLAASWRPALDSLYHEAWFKIKKLHRTLAQYGCEVTEQTVGSWIENSLIAPNDRSNIEIIAKAAGDEALLANMDNVWDAVCELRQMHIQAAGEMIAQLRHEVAKYMHAGLVSSDSPMITLTISDFGDVRLMQIDEIDHETLMIDAKRINKLYTEEAMMKWQE